MDADRNCTSRRIDAFEAAAIKEPVYAAPQAVPAEEIARLIQEYENLVKTGAEYAALERWREHFHGEHAARAASEAEATPLRRKLEEHRKALKPFAKEAERMRNYPDDYPYSIPTTPITVGHLRAAASVLSEREGQEE